MPHGSLVEGGPVDRTDEAGAKRGFTTRVGIGTFASFAPWARRGFGGGAAGARERLDQSTLTWKPTLPDAPGAMEATVQRMCVYWLGDALRFSVFPEGSFTS